MTDRDRRLQDLRRMRFVEVRHLATEVYKYLSYEDTMGDRESVYEAVIELELDRGIITSDPPFHRYTLDSNPKEIVLSHFSEASSWAMIQMVHDELIYKKGLFGSFLTAENLIKPSDLLGATDLFLRTLMAVGGDAALAIWRMRARIRLGRWDLERLNTSRFLHYYQLATSATGWGTPNTFKCQVCGRFHRDEETMRIHIGACRGWEKLDALASKLWFFDIPSLAIAMDVAEEQNWFHQHNSKE